MIVAVDYGMGNLRSVQKAGEHLGKRMRITDKSSTIKKASKIIFPGVGHFGEAVRELKKRKMYDVLKERIASGVPFLGICLGMQLLFEKSEEALELIIRDNGIGREKANAVKNQTLSGSPAEEVHHSLAIKITKDRLRLLNKKQKKASTFIKIAVVSRSAKQCSSA